MSRYTFSAAGPQDDAALRARMAADWMRGSLSVSFRREPSYFAGSALQGERAEVYKCVRQDSGELVAMGARVLTSLHVNGEPCRVGLLSDGRVAAPERGGTLVARGYKVLRQLHEADPMPFYVSVILEGNQAAQSSLASGRAGLPRVRDFGRMLTPAIHLDLPKPPLPVAGVLFRRAQSGDGAAVARLLAHGAARRQFSRDAASLPPGLRVEDFFVAERGSELVACVAAWDQNAVRQTHIEAYTPWLAALRPLYNAATRVLPLKPLPANGARIPHLYLCSIAMRDDDVQVFRGLLRHAYRELRTGPWHYAITALHERDPLAVVLAGYRSIRAAGRVFVFHYEDGADAVARIDGRVPYVDMARI